MEREKTQIGQSPEMCGPNSAVNQPIMKALVFCILTKNFGGPTEWGVGGRSSSALLWLKEEL